MTERVSDKALHYYVTMRHPEDEGHLMARELIERRAAERWKFTPVAWSLRSKTGLLRGINSGAPSEETIAIAAIDGDTIEYYALIPQPPKGEKGVTP